MPKNTQGGKKFKKGKNLVITEAPLELKQNGECYACVTQLLGHGRVYCNVYTNESIGSSSSFKATQRLGIIRGAMRKKKQWVKNGDIILVSIREYEKEKVDVLHVYSDSHKLKLIKKEEIPNIDSSDGKNENTFTFENDSDSDSENEIIKQNTNKNKEKEKGCTISVQSYIPDFRSDTDDEIENI